MTLPNLSHRCPRCGRMMSWKREHQCGFNTGQTSQLRTPDAQASARVNRALNNHVLYYTQDVGCATNERRPCLQCQEPVCLLDIRDGTVPPGVV